MRRYFVDNIRIFCIFLLFPFHAAMCFNSFGDSFYVLGTQSKLLSYIVVAVYPWWMSLLFALAGISSVYALKKRTPGEYARERTFKLLIPLIAGLVFIVPLQTYIADVYHNGYSGGYFEHYIKFFTTLTDFNGYDGSFTPAHLWFILYLFIISMITLPLMNWYTKRQKKFNAGKISLIFLVFSGFLIITLSTLIADIGGKSLGDFTACFLLGFFVLSDDEILDKLEKHCLCFGVLWLLLIVLRCVMWSFDVKGDLLWDIEYKALEWIGILAALGIGKRFLNTKFKFTAYFSYAAFPMYFFHQTVLVILAYFVLMLKINFFLQYIMIVAGSFILTVAVYELFKRIPLTRLLFGIKRQKV